MVLAATTQRTLVCEITNPTNTPLLLWAEAVATACYTLNRSLVHTLHGKTYYELLKGKKPNLLYFRVFGSLCYPTNDYDDVGKLKAKADIGIFVGYAPTKKAPTHPTKWTSVPNSTELELTALQSGRNRSALVKDPEPPSVPPTKKQNAIGSPSQQLSQRRSAVTEEASCLFNTLQDTSDSDDETLFDHVDNKVVSSRSNGFPKLSLDEYGDVLKNKARLVAEKVIRQGAGIDFENHWLQLLA
ncbi:retrovirus-related pol polyprotein from transposon TNT 1-94 [Tanacetum coccineum]